MLGKMTVNILADYRTGMVGNNNQLIYSGIVILLCR
jgi:hypothetical protein